MGVDIVGCLLEFAALDRLGQLHNAVLHLVVAKHQDHQDPRIRQRHKVDMPQRKIDLARHRDHAGEAGHRRQQGGNVAQQVQRGGWPRRQLALKTGHFIVRQGLQLDQAVHEQAQSARRWHAARRSMRRGNQAGILKIRHDVANRGWAYIQAGGTRQCARAHRLAVDQILGDQRAQQAARAGIKFVAVRVDHALRVALV